jgi:hypothetical protein
MVALRWGRRDIESTGRPCPHSRATWIGGRNGELRRSSERVRLSECGKRHERENAHKKS